jgi:hypothetical protein
MKIVLKPNTVITMIGCSHSGKSVMSYHIKQYLESIGKSCVILESDRLRKEMLHLPLDANIPTAEGFAISELVFKKLKTDLNYYMQSQCNTDVIIVDTTGLDLSFREEIAKITKSNDYVNQALIFQLSKQVVFSRLYGEESEVSYKKFYIEKQLKRLKEKVLPKFNKHDYITVNRINDNQYDSLEFVYEDKTNVLKLKDSVHAFYGDVHQQIKELKSLHSKMKELSCSSHILIGDYIDKDDESSLIETLDFVYYECVNGKMKLIKGNHEEYVYRKLIDSNYVYEENEETQYFTSLKYLVDEKNDVFKKMFIELYEKYTYDYAEIKNDRNYAIISHSPCLERYLGKHSPKALKKMRNTRFFQNDDEGNKLPAMASMKDILDESASNKVLHVFGHVECGKDFHVYKNKICIDTACGKGGYLTALLYNVDSGKKEFYYEKSHKEALKPIYDFSYHIKPWTNKKIDLSPEQEKRLRRIVKADPAFISGTVSPSPSNLKGDISLESVETAIELFKSRNINKVIAQKKHMGSRCQVYLFKDRESCYATSRNGFKINKPEIESIIDKEYEKYKGKYDHLLITDNELMPWRFLGAGLIDNSFMPYYTAVNADFNKIKNSGLSRFLDIKDETYDNIEKFNIQANIYGKHDEGYLETFGIVYKDGQELITADQSEILPSYGIDFVEYDLNDEKDVISLKNFYTETIKDGITEGIVIKPLQWKKDDIPCIKVRNEEYLRIVYGFDYTSKLQKYAEDKNISHKLKLSIVEQNLNLTLLNAYAENNKELQKEIYSLLIVEFEKEVGLDPRL